MIDTRIHGHHNGTAPALAARAAAEVGGASPSIPFAIITMIRIMIMIIII
jgi:hypothetical protein